MKYNHFELKDFHEDNYRLYVEEPDADFSPEKNYAVINGTIDKYRKTRFGIDPKVQEAAGDRADIIASWAKYKLDKGGEQQFEGWLGKRELARIYGEKLTEKLKVMDTVRRLNLAKGNTKFKDYYLT